MHISHSDVVKSVVAYFAESQFADFFVDVEREIQMGSSVRRADIVLRDARGRFIAVAECKRPDEDVSGRLQLKSYLNATGTQFGLLATSTDSNQWFFCENKGGNQFRQISRAAFEARVLGESAELLNPGAVEASEPQAVAADNAESVEEGKPQSIRIWRYVAGVLGVGLLIAMVLLLLQSSTLEQPAVHTIGEVALIPAGEFQMGGSDSDAEVDEHPVHMVDVEAFYIDKYEVTNAQYKKFADANPQWQKDNIPHKFHNGKYLNLWQDNTYPPGKENHPVVYVSWYAAMAYAKWAGKRLPTEAEWEKAARGGVVGIKYPWGDLIDPSKANYGGEVGDTRPVGSYPPNDYGLYDMVGNVMEWCLDAYDEGFYSHSPLHNPIAGGRLTDIVDNFQNVTSLRVVRSGCWYNVPMHVRLADRYGTLPEDASKGRGFRCAGSATGMPK